MLVKDMITLLEKFNPEAEIVVEAHDGVCFTYIDKITTGVFELTDYGNDFWPDQKLVVNPAQVRAVCIHPEEYFPEIQQNITDENQ